LRRVTSPLRRRRVDIWLVVFSRVVSLSLCCCVASPLRRRVNVAPRRVALPLNRWSRVGFAVGIASPSTRYRVGVAVASSFRQRRSCRRHTDVVSSSRREIIKTFPDSSVKTLGTHCQELGMGGIPIAWPFFRPYLGVQSDPQVDNGVAKNMVDGQGLKVKVICCQSHWYN